MKAVTDTTLDQGKIKKGFIRVCRVVYLNSVGDLDLSNFGVHWTSNFQYNHNGGNDKGVCPCSISGKKIKVIAIVPVSAINANATSFSNEQHPKECEIVLDFNTEIQVEIMVSEKSDCGAWMRATEFYAATVSTGTRCDKWVFNPYN